tara:strand:+ start:939 stop:1121 length:183 start_codon:yes stop_codon:yes gene_type:complete
MAYISREDLDKFIEIEVTLLSLEKYSDLPAHQMKWVKDARRKASFLKKQYEESYLSDLYR